MPLVTMPKLSDTMEEGVVVEWVHRSGDIVPVGAVLGSIQTDKATFDLEAETEGRLAILVEAGQPVPVGTPIAEIMAAAEVVRPDGVRSGPIPPRGPLPAPKASPLVRRLARERGVDLSSVAPTGPDGWVVREDVLAAAVPGLAPPRMASPGPPQAPAAVIRPTRMERAIAQRMAHAHATVPDFSVTATVRVDEALRLRAQIPAAFGTDLHITLTDLVVRAAALALRRVPAALRTWADDHFEVRDRVHIALAVALEQGLVAPVIRDADRLDPVQIAAERTRLVESARAGRLSESDLSGGVFTVSNLGPLGVDEFTAVVTPPEAAILAVGAIREAVVVIDHAPSVGSVVTMTLSADHRVLYGSDAAQLLGAIRELLETPLVLTRAPTG